jgi:TP901 family phage tail tape measure protein
VDVMRRVVTLFEARGAGQVKASLGEMRSGFSGYRRDLDQAGRSTGYINNQLRALGTTLRYAFAGQAIFGTIQMVRNLGEFEGKLGEISSIATGSNGLPIVNAQLDRLGDNLIRVSNETAQPISDLQEGVLSLYSTIGNVPPDEASAIMKTISETAVTAQSNIQDTTQALLGMINAFGRGTKEIPKFGDEFYKVIALSANMPGSTYAQKLGVLSASASLARFTPEQMGGLSIGATRFGGSANTNMTYLAQLMTYLVNPTTAKEKAAFQSIGLSGKDLTTMPGMDILNTVLGAINQRGGVGVSKGLLGANDDTLNILDQMNNGAGPTNDQAGITGGGADLLNKLFGRIQSRRMAAILSKLYTPDQVAGTENQTLKSYIDSVTNSAGEMDKAMGRAMDRKRIQQAGNAVHNLGIDVGVALNPLLNPIARGITGTTSAFGNQKWGIGPVTGQEAELIGGGVGAALLLRRLRGVGSRGGLVRGVAGLGAATDALTETAQGHTPLHPLYVWVVGTMGGIGGRTAGGPVPYRDPRIPNEDMRTAGAGAAVGRSTRLTRGVRAARFGAGAAGMLFPAALVGAGIMDAYGDVTRDVSTHQKNKQLLDFLMVNTRNARQGYPTDMHFRNLNQSEAKIIADYSNRKITSVQAEAMLRKVAPLEQQIAAGLGGKVKGTAEITIKDERTRKKHHVTVDLLDDFKTPAPQTKGKNRSYRGCAVSKFPPVIKNEIGDNITKPGRFGIATDPAKYLIALRRFERPKLSVPGGGEFEWPIGTEGVRIHGNATLAEHHYIGDDSVALRVMHLDDRRIEMSGMFPGLTAIGNVFDLLGVITAEAPDDVKLLSLPGINTYASMVVVESYDFNHPDDDRTNSFAYTVTFRYTGRSTKRVVRPPVIAFPSQSDDEEGSEGEIWTGLYRQGWSSHPARYRWCCLQEPGSLA